MLTIRTLSFLAFLAVANTLFAQQPTGAPGNFDPSKMNIGRFYGKVVDENNKGVPYATVKLFGTKFNPETKTREEALLGGQLTEDNGDFSLEKLPVVGDFTLKIEYIGYKEISQKVTFGIKPPQPGQGKPPGAMGGNFDKDLGNIRLEIEATTLQGVTINGEAAKTTLALDRKVYRVDKDATAAGGNAQDALKNVPSLSVDIDGNVSLRNGAPQIFVDGRPTTLTLDQIAADAIESVEVITNPSAKYDAGGGTAGIVNIVLKKEKRLGYNGSVRAGVDSRKGGNFGGDINARGDKVNLFASAFVNNNQGKTDGETFRQNLTSTPLTNIRQTNDGLMSGIFANGRAGIDWLMDNRNTLTISGNYTRGAFNPTDNITTRIDSLFAGTTSFSQYVRASDQDRNFRNLGSSVQFKHLFPKQGAEWTADVNYNRVKFMGDNAYETTYDNGRISKEKQLGSGNGQFATIQTDFVTPLTDKIKIEGGARAYIRFNKTDNVSSFYNQSSEQWEQVSNLSDRFKYTDQVYAAYGQFSQQFDNWGYQAGLRAESSFYTGSLTDTDSSFTIAYPVSLFPSVFLTRKINETDNIQLAYSRRVNRPNFFQTMPFTDFSDSLNLRRGNPQLKPEFTNSLELSYQKIFNKGHNILASLYFKQATNLITTYLFSEFNTELNKDVTITGYANSNQSYAYGGELTLKNTITKWLDLTTNINVYQSRVDASNVENSLTISRLTSFLKENIGIKLPAGLSLQLSGEYHSKASFTPSNNNDPFRGGSQQANTAQGYAIDYWFADAAVRKDLFQRKASVTLGISDIFATRRGGTYTENEFFIQDTWRIRNPQLVRLNFSYRFGKMDTSLFRRKNMRTSSQGSDMM